MAPGATPPRIARPGAVPRPSEAPLPTLAHLPVRGGCWGSCHTLPRPLLSFARYPPSPSPPLPTSGCPILSLTMNYPEDDTFEGSDATGPVTDAPEAAIISPERHASPPAFGSQRAAALFKSWNTVVLSSTAPEVESLGKAKWSGRLRVVRRYVNFCGCAFAPLSSTGEVTDADAWRIAMAHDDDAPGHVLRLLLGILLGECGLVEVSGEPVSTAYVRNIRGYLSWMFASARVGLCAGPKFYSNCASASAA